MKLAYVRVSKTHSEQAQRKLLEAAGFGDWSDEGPVYVDAKPRRGEASWYWRGKLLDAVRPGDEVYLAEASVWGSSLPDAIEALQRLTEKQGVLCIASTGERFQWHADAAGALGLAARIARENSKRATDAARSSRRENTRKRKASQERKIRKAKKLWEDHSLTGEEAAQRAGYSRSMMIRLFGARGTPRFRSPRVE